MLLSMVAVVTLAAVLALPKATIWMPFPWELIAVVALVIVLLETFRLLIVPL